MTLATLRADCANYLNRTDITTPFPGWVAIVETKLTQTLRARCQLTSAYQAIDRDYIPLPSNFATMDSIRDATTGELLDLKDQWSGHWTPAYQPYGWQPYDAVTMFSGPACQYRIVANCIEFMPHLTLPDPPDPTWVPQQVLMSWFTAPVPLLNDADSNVILEQLYDVYLWGVLKYASVWALDDARAQQADALWQQAIAAADLYTQQSTYSGAPLRAELATVF